MTTRIATLNIRQGGTKYAEALTTRLLGYDADILVVTEFRANAAGDRLINRLTGAGYNTSHPDVAPNVNTVLIAARGGIKRSWAFDDALDPRHLWCAEIDGAYVCGVYMPQGRAKLPYWATLIDKARAAGIDLLIGDFNTGNNDLDKNPRGSKFIGPEMPGRLSATGYLDVWRSLHPGVREYSWFSRPRDNGFRLDHIYAAPELAQRIWRCEFDHAPRLAGETDHSGLVAAVDHRGRWVRWSRGAPDRALKEFAEAQNETSAARYGRDWAVERLHQEGRRMMAARPPRLRQRRDAFAQFAPMLQKLTDQQLEEEIENPNQLLLQTGTAGRRRIDIAYAPFDDANVDARLVLVGLTPGRQQMRNALQEARRGLRAGLTEAEALAAAESFASFSGPMRNNLVAMLDYIGVHRLLKIDSTLSLWDADKGSVHFTSVCCNPVFVDGKNYSGAPPLLTTPILREQLETCFVPEVQALRHSIFVPLGTQVGQAVAFAAAQVGVEQDRVLQGLPHPSGANAERIAFFLRRKAREDISTKVEPDRLIAARTELKRKVTRLKRAARAD